MLLFTACSNGKKSSDPSAQDTVKKQETATMSGLKNIVFFGNSITAGYGLEQSEAFPSLIQMKIDSLKLPYNVINAGVSGETSAGGETRVDWVLKQPMDVFVLELGGNDGLRGISPEETAQNLQSIIDKVRTKYPSVKLVLLGMQMPPNMGQHYITQFREIYPRLADKNNMTFLPFLLEGVGGVDSLNQSDGIHPTAAGARIVAESVWSVLKPILAE